MWKPLALATSFGLLVATTSGCVVDIAAMADLPNATIMTSRSGGMRGGGPAVVVTDVSRADVIVPPARRGTAAPTPAAGSSDARNPVIQAFTANPSNFVPAGQPITFTVVAHDPMDQPMQFNWSSTGGMMSANSGQVVTWIPPEKPGTYTVSTIITNARGGAVSGSQNLIVQGDGSAVLTAAVPAKVEPAPVTPKAEPQPEPVKPAPVKPAPVKPAPKPVDPCGCDTVAAPVAQDFDAPMEDAPTDEDEFASHSWTRFARR